jgi:hypothetical protein
MITTLHDKQFNMDDADKPVGHHVIIAVQDLASSEYLSMVLAATGTRGQTLQVFGNIINNKFI